ncbi:S-adenosyl-L-methionine-dependent methyltransferase [Chytriomyces sp. MP71]|nr:S-adenosyl-L-methionine-dependent methyltransferase [Chytriomyces sp. MP71]
MKTPSLSHFSSREYEHVYEPAEDTFLLLDALEADASRGLLGPDRFVCLEVGSGSGCVSVFLQMLSHELGHEKLIFTTDINPIATTATAATAVANHTSLHPIRTHFASGLRLPQTVDILVFNPPYVVTPSSEVGGAGIEASWAGGVDGMEVTNAFLPHVEALLSARGLFYLVAIRENGVEAIRERLRKEQGLYSEVRLPAT